MPEKSIFSSIMTSSSNNIDSLKLAMEYVNISFSISDALANGRPLIYVNPAFEQLTGYSAAEVLGKNCNFLQSDEQDQISVRQIRTALREGAACSVVIKNYRKDGTLFWNQLHLSPIRNAEGVITHFVGIQIDVTEIKIMEEEFRQSRQMLQLVMDNIPMTIFWKDTQSKFLGCNRQFMVDAGVDTVEEVIGKRDDDFPWCEQASGYQAVDKEVMQTGISRVGFEEEIVKLDGEMRTLSTTKIPLRDAQGKVIGILGMHEDITERKYAEQELRKADLLRMEVEAEREVITLKEKFVSTVSHEFRSPLAAIVTSTELLDRFRERISLEKRNEHLKIIKTQTSHMRKLLDDLLIISQGKLGKIQFSPHAVDLALLCKSLIEQIKVADIYTHHVTLNIDENIHYAEIDETLFRHIFVNLLTNAHKYSLPGSEIHLDIVRGVNEIVFTIKDQGIGIPMADQPQLFEPFHRANNVNHIQGTGLGLAIVKESVQAHRGSIWFESSESEGTTFTVRLPIIHA